MSKIMEMCNFPEKKAPAACTTDRKPLKSHYDFFEKMTRPKFSKMLIFQKKKRLRHARPAENSLKRHSGTFPTQPSPNTTPKI